MVGSETLKQLDSVQQIHLVVMYVLLGILWLEKAPEGQMKEKYLLTVLPIMMALLSVPVFLHISVCSLENMMKGMHLLTVPWR